MILKQVYFHLGWSHDNGEEDMGALGPKYQKKCNHTIYTYILMLHHLIFSSFKETMR